MWKDARTQTRMWGIGVNTDWTLHWGWQRDTHRHNRNLMSGDFVGYMTQSSTLNSNSLEDPRISKGRPTATSSIQSPSVTGIMKPSLAMGNCRNDDMTSNISAGSTAQEWFSNFDFQLIQYFYCSWQMPMSILWKKTQFQGPREISPFPEAIWLEALGTFIQKHYQSCHTTIQNSIK